MQDEEIPHSHHLSRYCPPSTLRPDGTPSGVAFRLKTHRNERYLSVNWLENASTGNRAEQMAAVRKAFADKGFGIAATARFAVANVSEMVRHVRLASPAKWEVCATHQPDPPDVSHSGVFGYTYSEDDDIIADLLAEKFVETHQARP